jgi:hypothetical protein
MLATNKNMDTIMKKKAQRFLYLKRLYEITEGDTFNLVARKDIGRELGWDESTTDGVTNYLQEEGLMKSQTFTKVGITHRGVKSIEAALNQPDKPTDYFPAANIIIVVNGNLTVGGDIVGRDKTTTD